MEVEETEIPNLLLPPPPLFFLRRLRSFVLTFSKINSHS